MCPPLPVLASYCTTFLKPEMAHLHRQVIGVRAFRTFVLAKSRLNAERYPFPDVELLRPDPGHFARRFYLKYLRRAHPFVYRGEYGALEQTLRRRRADLMHVYFGHTGVHLLPFIKAWGKPTVVSFHGVDVGVRPEQPDYEPQLRELLRSVPLVLARSESLRRRLLELGCPPGRVRLNRTGIPLEQFPPVTRTAPVDGSWRLVQACRLIAKKGIGTALQAFQRFLRAYPRATFTVAGDGPLAGELRKQAHQLGLRDRVRFLGFLSQPKLYELYASSHLFLHPSELTPELDQEGVPNAMLEAMATGLPVAATRHGGIPEAVTDGVEGWLVPERDPVALGEALGRAVASAADWEEAARNAAERVARDFEHRAQMRELETNYQRLLATGRPEAHLPAALSAS